MAVLKITNQNFKEEVLLSDKTVLIDFYADWCGPCKAMAPIVEEISNEMVDTLKVGKINVDDNKDLAMEYEIMSIPTLIIFKKGKIENKIVGIRDKQEIEECLK